MGIIRESFLVFKNWIEAINKLPEEYQLETFKALANFGITGEIPQGLSPIADAMITSFSVGMENNIARYTASVENGKKGGAPKGNQNARKHPKEESENNLENNLKQPKTSENNLYDNVNVNDNVNDIQLVNNKNKFENFELLNACVRVRERNTEEREPYIEKYKQFFVYHSKDKFADAGYELIDTIIEASEQAETEKGLTFKQKHYDKQSFDTVIRKLSTNQFENIVSQLVFNQEIENRPAYIIGCLIENGRSYGSWRTEEIS